MKCKKIYVGEELLQSEWEYGIGSIYLSGPRNSEKKSWRLNFIDEIEKHSIPVSILIPETKNQLKNNGRCRFSQSDIFAWQNVAAAVASTIVFWYPAKSSDVQSYVEFGTWFKVERAFYGRRGPQPYMDWLYYKEQRLYPAETLEELAEMVVHWIKE